jgi:hypothetical protein
MSTSLISHLMVDGGFFCLKPLFWFLTNTYFSEAFMWWLLVFFHSRASTTEPLLLQNSTKFIEVTWLSSLEFWSYFLIGAFSLHRSPSLPFNASL